MIELNYRDAGPIYDQIKNSIKQMIYNEVLEPEEKLPSVRDMASKLAINPNTIARAYRELELEGYLYTQSGVGTFVSQKAAIKEQRVKELYVEFDDVGRKLLFFDVSSNELKNRIESMAKGGNTE